MTEYRKGDVCSLEVVVEGENPLRAGSFRVKFPCGDHGFYLSEHLSLIRRAPVDLATCDLSEPVDVVGVSSGRFGALISRHEKSGWVKFDQGLETVDLANLRPRDAPTPAAQAPVAGVAPAPDSEVERLRAALEEIARGDTCYMKTPSGKPEKGYPGWFGHIAREAIAKHHATPSGAPPGHIMIGDRAVPEPMREVPGAGQRYWIATTTFPDLACLAKWQNDIDDRRLLSLGLIHSTEANARAHAEAIIALSAGGACDA